jgi:hypothetical protein
MSHCCEVARVVKLLLTEQCRQTSIDRTVLTTPIDRTVLTQTQILTSVYLPHTICTAEGLNKDEHVHTPCLLA